jgi:hypothetical protein
MTQHAPALPVRPINLPMTRNPVTAFEWTAVFVRPPKAAKRQGYLWLAESKPSSDPVTNAFAALLDLSTSVSGYQLWFFRGVWDLTGTEHFLQEIRQGKFPVTTLDIPLALQERPMVMQPAQEASISLVPYLGQTTWLLEFWDKTKNIKSLNSKNSEDNLEWIQRVNAAIKDRLGLDLNYWSDRIGNILLFIPTGVQVNWDFDHATQSAVLRTDLGFNEVQGYEIELEALDDQDVSYRKRQPLELPNAVFPKLELFRRVRATLWKDGQVIYQSDWWVILKSILMDMGLNQGTRAGRHYTSSAVRSGVGELEQPAWIRLSREREADAAREGLRQSKNFIFYEPGSRDNARKDLIELMNRAHQSVRLWDPYFGRLDDDIDLLERLTNTSVRIEILTSCDKWTQTGGSTHLLDLQLRLQNRLMKFRARFSNMVVKAWVHGGETAFHDRFLIIDEEDTWLLGSSINSLGSKHSTLIKVQHANQIEVAFDRIWRTSDVHHFEVFRGH